MTPQERTRSELLEALSELSRARQKWRLGQTLAKVAMTVGRLDPGGVCDLKDDEALIAVRGLLSQFIRAERVGA